MGIYLFVFGAGGDVDAGLVTGGLVFFIGIVKVVG